MATEFALRALPESGTIRTTELVNRPAITAEQIKGFRKRKDDGKGYPKHPRPATRGLLDRSPSWLNVQMRDGLFPKPILPGLHRVEDVRAWLMGPTAWAEANAADLATTSEAAKPKLAAVRQVEHAHA